MRAATHHHAVAVGRNQLEVDAPVGPGGDGRLGGDRAANAGGREVLDRHRGPHQAAAIGWHPETIYVCSGAATQAGLVLAKQLLRLPFDVVGVSASPFVSGKDEIIARVAGRAASLLGFPTAIAPAAVTNLDGYIGEGYGALTDGSIEAMRLAARHEGLLLDPTYTAKAFAALVDRRRRAVIAPDAAVLFLHTGGTPNLFLGRNARVAEA